MSFGTLVFSSKDWLIPAILLVGIAVAILVWSYRATPADRNIRLACFSLKLIGLITLGLVLLEPLLSRERASPGSNMFVILADNSQGMNMRDNLASRTRGETMRDILTSDTVT